MKVLNFLEKTREILKYQMSMIEFPDIINKIEEEHMFYSQPFKPELIAELFEGWELFPVATDSDIGWETEISKIYLISSRECIEYTNKGQYHYELFPIPRTLDDFISDCQRAGIELIWKV